MKIALFYDWLNQWGGAEKVFLDLINLYPQADIFTLRHDPQKTSWLPKNKNIITPSINLKFPPAYPLLAEQLDFSGYDIVISSTSYFGHCLLTPPKTLFICYCHTPNRQVWLSSKLKFYQAIDKIFSQRPDYFLASSKNSQKRIKNFYHRQSTLVYPGINLSKFTATKNPTKNYFLIVSRLVPHKRVDLAIKACQNLNLPLKIVGTGRSQNYLKSITSSKKIEFLGFVNQKKLISLYQNCTALICPQKEDFGLTPLESLACGRPVIAFKAGGFLETLSPKTALFFKQQTTSSLTTALKQFNPQSFNSKDCLIQAHKFSKASFMLNFKKATQNLWQLHQKTITQ